MTVRQLPQPVNLVAGQYQFGNCLFGRGTTVRVEDFKINPYDVNVQDYQITRADEMGFGWDQLKPTTIEITFHVLNNRMLPGYESLIPNFWSEMPTVADFQKEWKFDQGRYVWGATKSLYVCDRNGLTKQVFCRPGQFTPGNNTSYTETVQCIGELRRLDTHAYGITEHVSQVMTQASPTVTIAGTDGDGPSWLYLLIRGPVTDPVITIDGLYNQPNPVAFPVARTVADGEVIEINGQPWTRRSVSSNGEEISADLGEYEDKLRFYCEDTIELTLTGTGMNSSTAAVAVYRDAYETI
jgi:hypothetical protein